MVWLAGALAVHCMSSAGASLADEQPVKRPNIVLIVSDDQGYHDLGCTGNAAIKTPRLDRLAAEGVRLTDFYVTWPACTPSRGSILTGRYPQRNGLYEMIRNDMVNFGYKYSEYEYSISPEMTLGLDTREVVIAQPLHNAGYACGMIGKWDSGRARRFLPLARGFDMFYGFANTGIDYFTHERYGVPSMFRGNERIKDEGYATDLFGREAVKFIRENQRRPFFLYLAFNAPHGASSLTDRSPQVPDSWLSHYPALDPKDNRTKYKANVTCMDAAIGEVLDTLRTRGLEDHTLVMFLSDNGGAGSSDNGPLRGRKSQLFEGGIRVPFVARFPGRIPAGRVSNELLTSLELFPTILAAAGVAPPQGLALDGHDMLPVLAGQQKSPRTEMYWQHQTNRAVRMGNIKWVETGKGGGLFDLAADMGEAHDLSAQRPELLAEMKSRWAAWRKAMDETEPRGPFRDY